MRIVIQRVSEASVTIDGKVKSEIGWGLLVLLGIDDAETTDDNKRLVKKDINLR
nr:D-aminoacyl-tRNA deacylase [Bacteroidales bacterium]